MNILYFTSDQEKEWNSSGWRCTFPAKALNTLYDWKAETMDIKGFAKRVPAAVTLCEWADIIVVQRLFIFEVAREIMHWRMKGKVVIGDVDDAYHFIEPSNPGYRFWKAADVGTIAKAWEHLFLCGRVVNAVTMPSIPLQNDWKPYARTYFINNYLDMKYYRSFIREHADDSLVIGWGGSQTHVGSFDRTTVLRALERIARRYPKVKILTGGGVAVAKGIRIPPEQYGELPWVRQERWPEILSNFDIGIIPLDSRYDSRRSWLKSMEYLAMDIPWVGTKSPVTEKLAFTGTVIDNSPKNWEFALSEVIENFTERKLQAQKNSKEYGHMIDLYANATTLAEQYEQIYHETKDVIVEK